jgi:hypothetical protein
MFLLLDGGSMDLEMWKGRHPRGDVCWMMTNGRHHLAGAGLMELAGNGILIVGHKLKVG